MPDLKSIRNRISSVKNTRQITRAMKMVAAAKLRRAQEGIVRSRPYAYRIYSILLSLLKREGVEHPLLVTREEKKILLIVLSGDRGLCGAFNSNIFKEATRVLKAKKNQGLQVDLECIGKKGYDFFKKKENVTVHHEGLLANVTFQKTTQIADEILKAYLTEKYDAVYMVYNEFKSAIQQKVVTERLIPISTEVPDGVAGVLAVTEEDRFKNYIYEPSQEEILNEVIPRHFKMQFFRAVLESVASEHGSRMAAMENATKNASEMMEGLTLEYNKARQAAITKELMEIVGGVEAMKG